MSFSTPGGQDRYLQFNSGSHFLGHSNFRFDSSLNILVTGGTKVGIGTTTPSSQLHIVNGQLFIDDSNVAFGSAPVSVNANFDGVGANFVNSFNSANSVAVEGLMAASNPASIAVYGHSVANSIGVKGDSFSGIGGHFSSTSGPAIYVPTGNVGVFQATPLAPIHVGSGNVAPSASVNVYATNNADTLIQARDSGSMNDAIIGVLNTTPTIGTLNGLTLNIQFGNQVRGVFTAQGNIGFNTNTPQNYNPEANVVALSGFPSVALSLVGDRTVDGVLSDVSSYNDGSVVGTRVSSLTTKRVAQDNVAWQTFWLNDLSGVLTPVMTLNAVSSFVSSPGLIESGTGFKFPDGSIQITATGSSGAFIQNQTTLQAATYHVIDGYIDDALGIGTASPLAPLHIVNGVGLGNIVIVENSNGGAIQATSVQDGPGSQFSNSSSGPLPTALTAQYTGSNVQGVALHGQGAANGVGVLGTSSFGPGACFSSLTSFALIVPPSKGSVGIGTFNPTSLLDVGGDVTADNLLVRNAVNFSNGSLTIGFKAPAAIPGTLLFTLPSVDGTSNQVLATDGNQNLSFQTQAAVTSGNFINNDPTPVLQGATFNVIDGRFTRVGSGFGGITTVVDIGTNIRTNSFASPSFMSATTSSGQPGGFGVRIDSGDTSQYGQATVDYSAGAGMLQLSGDNSGPYIQFGPGSGNSDASLIGTTSFSTVGALDFPPVPYLTIIDIDQAYQPGIADDGGRDYFRIENLSTGPTYNIKFNVGRNLTTIGTPLNVVGDATFANNATVTNDLFMPRLQDGGVVFYSSTEGLSTDTSSSMFYSTANGLCVSQFTIEDARDEFTPASDVFVIDSFIRTGGNHDFMTVRNLGGSTGSNKISQKYYSRDSNGDLQLYAQDFKQTYDNTAGSMSTVWDHQLLESGTLLSYLKLDASQKWVQIEGNNVPISPKLVFGFDAHTAIYGDSGNDGLVLDPRNQGSSTSPSVIIGKGDGGVNYQLKFDGNSNDGTIVFDDPNNRFSTDKEWCSTQRLNATLGTNPVLRLETPNGGSADLEIEFTGNYTFFGPHQIKMAGLRFEFLGLNGSSGAPYGDFVAGSSSISGPQYLDLFRLHANPTNFPSIGTHVISIGTPSTQNGSPTNVTLQFLTAGNSGSINWSDSQNKFSFSPGDLETGALIVDGVATFNQGLTSTGVTILAGPLVQQGPINLANTDGTSGQTILSQGSSVPPIWGAGGGGSPGGSDNQFQYKNGAAFAGAAGLNYVPADTSINVGGVGGGSAAGTMSFSDSSGNALHSISSILNPVRFNIDNSFNVNKRDFEVDGKVGAALLYVNATSNNVGIGTSTPGTSFTVAGNLEIRGLLTPTLQGATFGYSSGRVTTANEIAAPVMTTNALSVSRSVASASSGVGLFVNTGAGSAIIARPGSTGYGIFATSTGSGQAVYGLNTGTAPGVVGFASGVSQPGVYGSTSTGTGSGVQGADGGGDTLPGDTSYGVYGSSVSAIGIGAVTSTGTGIRVNVLNSTGIGVNIIGATGSSLLMLSNSTAVPGGTFSFIHDINRINTASNFAAPTGTFDGVTVNRSLSIQVASPKAALHGASLTILGAHKSPNPDSDLGNGQVNFWVDEPGNNLTFKVKYSSGTVKSGTVALT